MQERHTESEFQLVVTGTRRDGRRRYDEQSKRSLARACLQPGVSLAGIAFKHGVNANLLRKWVVAYKVAPGVPSAAAPAAFVPVMLGSSPHTAKPASAPPLPAAEMSSVGSLSPAPLRLRAQMPNGVTVEFECASGDALLLTSVIHTLAHCYVSPGR
ncbi:transposase [Rugamonas sp. A1-17]|nr:transposase [Rugamonas sp. A1-17]